MPPVPPPQGYSLVKFYLHIRFFGLVFIQKARKTKQSRRFPGICLNIILSIVSRKSCTKLIIGQISSILNEGNLKLKKTVSWRQVRLLVIKNQCWPVRITLKALPWRHLSSNGHTKGEERQIDGIGRVATILLWRNAQRDFVLDMSLFWTDTSDQ